MGLVMQSVVSALRAMFPFVIIAASNFVPVRAAPSRPNFVFIYADDWRWDALGVVQREQGERARVPWLQTPRLDHFANEAIRFRNAFVVNSLCSPGRACVLTGRYSHRNGIIGNSTPFPTDADNFAKNLESAGYNTGYFGKWHMDAQEQRPGFNYIASFIGQGKYIDCPILLNGGHTPTKGWIDDVSTEYAIKFVNQQSDDKPFFLWLGFKSPHGPRGGENLPERARHLYAGEEARGAPNMGLRPIFRATDGIQPNAAGFPSERAYESCRTYMRHITAIDHCVGQLLDALDRTGKADNTIVIITSDNGYYLGEHGLSDKRSAYEESIRVPLLIRMPGENRVRAAKIDKMVLNIDHAATILDLAGATPLAEGQGRSMRPLLAGDTPANWRQAFLYEYFKEPQFASPTVLAIRTEKQKLITYPGHDEWTEVFDLANDPYETKNLAGDTSLLDDLRARFDAESKAVQFRMPELPASPKKPPANRPKRNRNRSAA
jgi:arylsulfatase A-like enzyme